MSQTEQRERLVALVPQKLKRLMEESAKANRRSLTKEVQTALEGHVAGPGSRTDAGASI